VVLLDIASVHSNGKRKKLKRYGERGLFLFYLPLYSHGYEFIYRLIHYCPVKVDKWFFEIIEI